MRAPDEYPAKAPGPAIGGEVECRLINAREHDLSELSGDRKRRLRGSRAQEE